MELLIFLIAIIFILPIAEKLICVIYVIRMFYLNLIATNISIISRGNQTIWLKFTQNYYVNREMLGVMNHQQLDETMNPNKSIG